jgi:integrase
MAKRVRDADLESRAGRSKLKPRGKPYYKAIGDGLHVGYRKGSTGSKWVARRYVGDGTYVVETIATADDIEDADGERVLNFCQAQERARAKSGQRAAGPYKVSDAVAAYLEYLGERATAYDGSIKFRHHILPQLGDELVDKLTTETIRGWHRKLSKSLPLVRMRADGTQARAVDFKNAEVIRSRQVSANRYLSILKAALNHAFRYGKVASDIEWRRVKPFENVEQPRGRYFTFDECTRLLNASDEEFRPLVRGALETGARYGELCRLRCGDFNPDSGTLHIRKSKSGKERHIILTDDGRTFFGQLIAGRPVSAPMFGREWKRSHQLHRMDRACKHARIEPAVGFHQLRHTWASHAVMGGMPLPVVARNLGHVDTRMVEKHYGHLAPSYVVDAVRKHAPRFGGLEPSNIVLAKTSGSP